MKPISLNCNKKFFWKVSNWTNLCLKLLPHSFVSNNAIYCIWENRHILFWWACYHTLELYNINDDLMRMIKIHQHSICLRLEENASMLWVCIIQICGLFFRKHYHHQNKRKLCSFICWKGTSWNRWNVNNSTTIWRSPSVDWLLIN